MVFLSDLFHNRILMSAFWAWLIAQVSKAIIHLIVTKKWEWERLLGSGGMPSSHSSTVCALATSTGIIYGAGSFEFAITFIFAIVVMCDARGVRLETGIQAKVLNEMMEFFASMGRKMSTQEKLKEFVGHTPMQVWIGATLGITFAFLYCLVLSK